MAVKLDFSPTLRVLMPNVLSKESWLISMIQALVSVIDLNLE